MVSTASPETNSETSLLIVQDDLSLAGSTLLSPAQKRVATLQFLALCFSLFVLGWNDGSTGTLLPRIQEVYNVSYGTVSWIFAVLCMGAVLGGLFNMPLNDRLGFGKMIVLGAIFQGISFAAEACAPPFFFFVLTFFVGGLGMALQDAQANGFMATVKHDGEIKMGLLQAAYGAGALCAPLSATQFSQMTHWSFHYLVSLTLSLLNALFLLYVFRLKGQDDCLREAGEIIPEHIENTTESSKFAQMFSIRAVHVLALFLILYIGTEVTIGGWIVTFMLVERDGGAASGYVASGFFAGLTAGRVILIPVNQWLGEAKAVYLYTVLALFFQVIVWLVPSMIIGSIAVFCIGIVLGPMYPIVMRHSARVIPRSLVTGSIGWITAWGAAGSAILPFFTGALASHFGIISLQPYLVVMMIAMGATWLVVPKASLDGQ
ncbi:hypothetical protein D9613_001062 [Agrocybe pediades]|uniref:Major facilitator superfamily (MFS) profile domain-containing protein n=1 Tax=Agrocybe pediades TaxID=84607 RepID=A0A8H4VUC3_9AGAR|nr:hypothetical protein D9613_001062 [Agrocybe pediades]